MAGADAAASRYDDRIAQMTAAARRVFYDAGRGVFVSGAERQVSWASQAWMILAGVATEEEGRRALRAVAASADAVGPVTPYLYHYVVEAMLACGSSLLSLPLPEAPPMSPAGLSAPGWCCLRRSRSCS